MKIKKKNLKKIDKVLSEIDWFTVELIYKDKYGGTISGLKCKARRLLEDLARSDKKETIFHSSGGFTALRDRFDNYYLFYGEMSSSLEDD